MLRDFASLIESGQAQSSKTTTCTTNIYAACLILIQTTNCDAHWEHKHGLFWKKNKELHIASIV